MLQPAECSAARLLASCVWECHKYRNQPIGAKSIVNNCTYQTLSLPVYSLCVWKNCWLQYQNIRYWSLKRQVLANRFGIHRVRCVTNHGASNMGKPPEPYL